LVLFRVIRGSLFSPPLEAIHESHEIHETKARVPSSYSIAGCSLHV